MFEYLGFEITYIQKAKKLAQSAFQAKKIAGKCANFDDMILQQ